MEESDEFLDVVLQGRTGDEQLAGSMEAVERLVQLGFRVFETMSFVDGEVLPSDVTELCAVLENELVGGDEDVELDLFGRAELVLSDHGSTGTVANVSESVEVGSPMLQLAHPCGQRGEGHNDEEGAVLVAGMEEVREEGDGLNSLAETHLVGENAVLVLTPEVG